MNIFNCFFFLSIALIASSCTLSFQNISTHGTAEDLVDETQTNSPNVVPTVEIPFVGK